MNDLTVTVTGWAATDAKLHVGAQGTNLTSFRLASTPRYYDRTKEEWVDGQTEWFTVRAFRSAAITISQSIYKGQPVVVTGRMRTNEWEAEDGTRVDMVIDATAVGHDLSRGVGKFTRAVGDPSLDAPQSADEPAASKDGEEATEPDATDPEADQADDAAAKAA